MSILYDEDQRAIAEQARRVIEARYDKQRLLGLVEKTGAYDEVFWQTAIEQGWTGMAIPEGRGGSGLGLVELGIVAQACGAVTAGAPFLTTSYGLSSILEASGKTEMLPRLAAGQAIGTIAFAEGNEALPRTPCVVFANGKLTGTKHGVTAGLQAELAVVWVSEAGRPALVLAELSGATRCPVSSFDNARGYADLIFAGTPATLLVAGDAARLLALDILARLAVVTAHEQTGGAEALMLTARDYANTRKAFGQPIGAFQSVKHRIAELYGLVEIARANALHAASLEGQPGFLKAAAAARLSATEAYDTAARDCVQIHGGIGVTWEAGLHLHMRRARSLAMECGNALFWEDLLVDELLGEAA